LGQSFGENPRNFSKLSLKTDSPKISHLGDQFLGISEEFLRNKLQVMILVKVLGNSSRKVTIVGESGEIAHYC